MAASDPPAPGRISIRQGRWANGCTGTSEVIRDWEALASSVRVSPRSSAASALSSGSVVDSCISETSSVTDLAEISMCCFQALQKSHTSLALSHCCNAFTIGLYSPNFFATRVSKPLASFSVRLLCSTAILRALVRSAGGIDSSDAACAMLAGYACRIKRVHTGCLTSKLLSYQRPGKARKTSATDPRSCQHCRGSSLRSYLTRFPISASDTLSRDNLSTRLMYILDLLNQSLS
jgi:hypothetical protein